MSETYKQMIERQEKEVATLPIKWAFGQRQFEEMMTSFGLGPDDTDKICSIGAGGFLLKTDKDTVKAMFQRHHEEMKAALDADTTGDGFAYEMFHYELMNHEFIVTCSVEETLESCGLTLESVQSRSNLKHALTRATKEIIRGYEMGEIT